MYHVLKALPAVHLSLSYCAGSYYLTTDGLFASRVSILKSHPMNARGCYSIGCQYTIAQ